MSMCDNCIHGEVCGEEDNHDEAITFCAYMMPKDIFSKIRAEIDHDMREAPYMYDDDHIDELHSYQDGLEHTLNIINNALTIIEAGTEKSEDKEGKENDNARDD